MKKKLLLLLCCVVFTIQVQRISAETAVYYGDWDDRMQYYDLAKSSNRTVTDNLSYYQTIATSVCLITNASNIGTSTQSGMSKLYLSGTLYQKVLTQNANNKVKTICDDLRFKNEYVVPNPATGTLIDNNKILTANHVFTMGIANGALVCIFNYFKKSESDFPVQFEQTKPYVLIKTSDVYKIVETSSQLPSSQYHQEAYTTDQNDPFSQYQKYDWAVLTLDRNVSSYQKRICYYSSNDIISTVGVNYQELCCWGHPKGLSMVFTDDAHGKSTSKFLVDLDVYAGNSGSPVFIKRNSGNSSTFDYKLVGVVSMGQQDYVVKNGSAEGNSCQCFSDNSFRPNGTSGTGYIPISFLDDISTKTGISYNNCSTPWSPPVIEPKPTPSKQPVFGEEPLLRFAVDKNAVYTYIINMRYKINNNIYETASIAWNNTSILTKKMKFLPAGTEYNYTVYFPDGKTTLTSGSGKAGSIISGYTTTSTNTSSVAFVGAGVDYPFKTIQSAIDNALPNTVLHIARGVYKENIVINKSITLYCESYPATLIISDPASPAITIQANNVSVTGIYIENSGFTGIGISLNNVSNCVVKDCQLYGYSSPIALVTSSSNTLTNNFICGGNVPYGIIVNASTGNSITNNVVDYAFDTFNFISCSAMSNTFSGNILKNLRKNNSNGILPILNLLLD